MSDLCEAYGTENSYLSETEKSYIQSVRSCFWNTLENHAPRVLLDVLRGDSFRKLKDLETTKNCLLFIVKLVNQQVIRKTDLIAGLRLGVQGNFKMSCLESLVWLQCIRGIFHLILIAHAGMGYPQTLPKLINESLDDDKMSYILGRHGFLGIMDACPWQSQLDVQRYLLTGDVPEELKQMNCVNFQTVVCTSWNRSYVFLSVIM